MPTCSEPALRDALRHVDPAIQALHNATACYTREGVVDEVLDQVMWPAAGGRLLDPGAGDGAFLERAVLRLDTPRDDVEAVAARIEGWEIHPVAAMMARQRVAAALVGRGWTSSAAEAAARAIVIEADFLAPGPIARQYRVVAGNPPYLRWANLPDAFKARYHDIVPGYARADILHAFLDRCADVLTSDGRLALVTSDRWLFNENAAALREQIGRRFGVANIARLDVDTAFYRAKTRRKGTPPRVHPVLVALAPEESGGRPLGREPIYPGPDLVTPDGAVPLGEVAQVRIAPWMGPHGVFTLDADAADHLPAELLVPCVDTEDIDHTRGGIRAPRRVALRLSRAACPPAAVLEHLRATYHRLPRRAQRDLDGAHWWLPPENFTTMNVEQESLLIPRIARGLRPVRLPAGVVPLNHNLSIVTATPAQLDALEAALQSPFAQAWIAQRAGRLENGYFSITTNLLRQLPVRLEMPALPVQDAA